MSTLRAPNKGVILKHYKELGSIVTAGADVFELALSDQYWVCAYADEPLLGTIKRGEKMWIDTIFCNILITCPPLDIQTHFFYNPNLFGLITMGYGHFC